MTSYDFLAHIGGAVVALALVPQVYKTWLSKSAKDISYPWNSILAFGLFFWLAWGITNTIVPVMIFTTFELSLILLLLTLKKQYEY